MVGDKKIFRCPAITNSLMLAYQATSIGGVAAPVTFHSRIWRIRYGIASYVCGGRCSSYEHQLWHVAVAMKSPSSLILFGENDSRTDPEFWEGTGGVSNWH